VIETNLLPSGTTKRARTSARPAASGPSLSGMNAHPLVAGLGALAALLVLGGGFAVWRAGAHVEELRASVAEEQAEARRLEQTIALMTSLDTRRDSILHKMDVIREVDGRRYLWPHVMDEVSRAVPPYAWLTKLASQETPRATPVRRAPARGAAAADAAADTAAPPPPPVPQFTLEGHAGSTQVLTQFMKNLENSPMLREVTLVTSEQVELEGQRVLRFTLEVQWEEPDSAFLHTVPIVTVQ
jgi:Tfp pilus assembly protein PilN